MQVSSKSRFAYLLGRGFIGQEASRYRLFRPHSLRVGPACIFFCTLSVRVSLFRVALSSCLGFAVGCCHELEGDFRRLQGRLQSAIQGTHLSVRTLHAQSMFGGRFQGHVVHPLCKGLCRVFNSKYAFPSVSVCGPKACPSPLQQEFHRSRMMAGRARKTKEIGPFSTSTFFSNYSTKFVLGCSGYAASKDLAIIAVERR